MMERLTFDGNFCGIAQCRELPCPYNNACTQRQVWERLKQYEDSGLSPIAYEEAKKIIEPKREPATWVRYSASMMACSRCGRHTARHRFEYCPHCGAPMRERKEE